jgi:sugar lactone lactonase YvrE
MKRLSRLGLGSLGLVALSACGPGPLPAENPAQQEPSDPPIGVEVTNTAEANPEPAVTPAPALPEPVVEEPIVVTSDKGFKTPESVLFDPVGDRYLVSNINGGPSELDNNGFISTVKPDGTVDNLEFIAGGKQGVTLNAPKGLAIHAGTLFVADISYVRRFDAATGAPQGSIAFPGATFINDIAVDAEGTLYVTDSGIRIGPNGPTPTGTDAVYRVANGKVSTLAKGKQLNGPNGVALFDGSVLTVTFGNKQLLRLSNKGTVEQTVELPAGSLDGLVVMPDGHLLVSSWETSSVYIGTLSGTWSAVAENLTAPADIGFDPGRNRILVPLFTENELRFVPATVPGLPGDIATAPQDGNPPGATPLAQAPEANAATPASQTAQ